MVSECHGSMASWRLPRAYSSHFVLQEHHHDLIKRSLSQNEIDCRVKALGPLMIFKTPHEEQDDSNQEQEPEETPEEPQVVVFLSPRQSQPLTTTQRICAEIYQTEDSYVTDVRDLVVHFFRPLSRFAAAQDLELGTIATLCSSCDTILRIHEELLRQLTLPPPCLVDSDANDPFADVYSPSRRGTSTSIPSVYHVAMAFYRIIEYMKVYALYCAHYLCTQNIVVELRRLDARVAQFAMELCATASQEFHLDVDSNLIKPVQRICRYPLLFRELLRQVDEADENYQLLEQTLAKIDHVAALVNEKVRQAEHNRRLYELYQRIHPSSCKIELLQPSRTLLYEVVATVVNLDRPRWPAWLKLHRNASEALTIASPSSLCDRFSSESVTMVRRSSASGEKLRLILLSDVLLMAKKHEQKLKIKRQICLSCAIVRETLSVESTAPLSPQNNARSTPSFELVVSKVGRCDCHHLTPKTLKRASPKSPFRHALRRHSLSQTTALDMKTKPRKSLLPDLLRPIKHYVVTCASETQTTEFLTILQSAISRAGRIPLEHHFKPMPPSPLVHRRHAMHRLWQTLTTDLPQSIARRRASRTLQEPLRLETEVDSLDLEDEAPALRKRVVLATSSSPCGLLDDQDDDLHVASL